MPESVIINAPAKINLTLRIGARRDDGFHDIASIMQAISLSDTVKLSRSDSGSDELHTSGAESSKLTGPATDNLALRALGALRGQRPELPYCLVELQKEIPIGAGLGGGSSDCAAVLQGANELFQLNLSAGELIEVGVGLGSDVPFFFSSGSALVGGRGERFRSLNMPLDYRIVLINPGIHISTVEAFSELDRLRSESSAEIPADAENTPLTSPEIGHNFCSSGGETSGLRSSYADWWRTLEEEGNDFESVYLSNRCNAMAINSFADVLRQIQDRLRRLGADFIRMSGSGSTVFGVFCADNASDIDSERFDSIARRGWRVEVCHPVSLPDISTSVE